MGPASDRPGWLGQRLPRGKGQSAQQWRGWEKKFPTTTDEAGNGREEMRVTAVDP